MTVGNSEDAGNGKPAGDGNHENTIWVRRLRALEDENARLKKLLAEAILDNAILKDIASVKW